MAVRNLYGVQYDLSKSGNQWDELTKQEFAELLEAYHEKAIDPRVTCTFYLSEIDGAEIVELTVWEEDHGVFIA